MSGSFQDVLSWANFGVRKNGNKQTCRNGEEDRQEGRADVSEPVVYGGRGCAGREIHGHRFSCNFKFGPVHVLYILDVNEKKN